MSVLWAYLLIAATSLRELHKSVIAQKSRRSSGSVMTGFSIRNQSCQNLTVVDNDNVGPRELDTFPNVVLDAQH
jgi:hypothetical protein